MHLRDRVPAAALVVILLATFVIVMMGGPAPAGSNPSGQYVQGELIVKFKDAASAASNNRLLSVEGMAVVHENADLGFQVVKLPGGASVPDMVAMLAADPSVEYAEPNYIDHLSMTPNDPLYPNQWHMHDYASGGINAEGAWDTEEGDPSVIVAVVDTGVAYENNGSYTQAPDLAETTFVLPHDSVDGDGHPNDTNGHGTHVTGTIAQSTNNALGTAGVAHGCSVMPVRCLGTGGGSHAMMADAFTYAADNGAKVINYSAGGTDSTTKRDACQYAYEHGVTICAATGNDAGAIQYPAAYDDYVVAVGATDRDKNLAYYSNWGPQLDVVGPGGDTRGSEANGVLQQTYVTEDDPASGFSYQGWMGTSMATPHVTAAAALFISKTGISNPDAVKLQLEATAHDLGDAGWDDKFGYGLVDAKKAVTEEVVPLVDAMSPAVGLVGATVTIKGLYFGDDQGQVSFNGTAATDFESWAGDEIKVKVPAGATSGPVAVTTIKGTSNDIAFDVENPEPSINGLDPGHANAGDPELTMSVLGAGFVDGSVVRWDGSDRVTTFNNDSDLSATIPASDLATAGTASVTVFSPTPGGGTSNAKTFTINPPKSSVSSISPTSAYCGDTLTVNGTNFGSTRGTSYVSFGTKHATSYTSWTSTKIKVKVPSGCYWTRDVKVTTASGTSNAKTLKIKPHITAISPTSGSVGAYITVGGTGFGSGKSTSSVKFGTKLAYSSSTSWTDAKVKAKVPSLSKGKTTITVTTHGGTSNSYTFTVK